MISAHPLVSMCAVVGVADAALGEAVHAAVLPRPGESLDATQLRAFLEPRLQSAQLPQTIDIVTELPLSPVGKVLRRVVRESRRDAATPAAATS